MIRRPPRSTHCISSAASDVYKRQLLGDYAFLNSQKFKDLQQHLSNTDLCQNEFDLTYTSVEVCSSLLNQAMTRGLPQTLSQIVYDFRTEYQTTGFNSTKRVPNTPPLDHVYGAYYSSGVILQFTKIIKESMQVQTNNALRNVVKNGVLFLLFALVFDFFLVFYQNQKSKEEFVILKRIILIIPQVQFINSTHLFAQLQALPCTLR
eukprot:TRINITY_DN10323_c0_g1_i1.p1 TRINITY_DN10323_c0_g1~~TRINITY_DN10323_c0_g1_i1.p1  ORF type:complete len:206 (-),score=35.06 TRINITY_DN10323_c0_g1_i1:94-711(-)